MTATTATEQAPQTSAPFAVEAIRNAKGRAISWTIVSTDDDPLMILVDGEPFQVKTQAEATEALTALLDGELDGFDYSALDEAPAEAPAEAEPAPAPKSGRKSKADKAAEEATAKANAEAIRSMTDADLLTAIEQAAAAGSDLEAALVAERDRRAESPAEPKAVRPSRVRLGESSGVPAVKYDPAEKFPDHAEVIGNIRTTVAQLRDALAGTPTDPAVKARVTELNGTLNAELAAGYVAGLPITALGALIGVSASAARSRALRAALAAGMDVEGRTSADGAPVARRGSTIPVVDLNDITAKVRGRYGARLEAVRSELEAAHTTGEEDAFNGALYRAMQEGISIVALGQLLAVSASAARSRALRYAKRNDLPLPSKDDRKAARAALAVALADEN